MNHVERFRAVMNFQPFDRLPRWEWGHGGFFGPETPRTEMLCARIREFLKQYPVDWLLLDWFVYGMLVPNGLAVQPAEFVKKPFARIIGRPMPAKAEEITAQENLKY